MTEKSRATWAALAGMILHLLLGGLILAISVSSGSSACLALGFFTVITALLWGTAMLHTRQKRLAEEEERDLAETEKRGALFEDQDLGTLSAKAGLRRLELYLLPAATAIIAGLLIAAGIYLYARWWKEPPGDVTSFFMPVAIPFGFGSGLLFYGMYVKGMTSVTGWRLLRGGSSAMLFSAFGCFLISVTLILNYLGVPYLEKIAAWVIAVMTGVTGIELIFSMIAGIFVPRVPGAEVVPPYYSRMLDMITSPRDILKSVADIVDYQFGFRVSETWFYGFLEKAIMPLLLFWALVLYAFTCVVIVGPEEQAVLERFGRPFPGVLDSGLHWKLPWPIDIVYGFPAKSVQAMTIGTKEEIEDQPAITWTEKHYKEEDNFLVAAREAVPAGMDREGKPKYTPVSLVTAEVRLHYRVRDLHSFLYVKSNPEDFIRDIAYREIVKFLVSIDIFDLLKEKRLDLAEELRVKVQDVIDEGNIGVEVFYLGFVNSHPPVEVGEAYESVIKALEEKHGAVLRAEAYAKEKLHKAAAEAIEIKEKAKGYRTQRTTVSEAEAESFLMRMEPYRISPAVYSIRKQMTALEEGTEKIRKYIIPPGSKIGSNKIFNLEDKLQFGVEDIELTTGLEEKSGED